MTRKTRAIPRSGDPDLLLGLLREGYDYAGRRFERLGSDIFRTRLLGRPAVCLRGAEAAELFYDESRFTREGAMPKPVLRLLQDKGSVATLEGEAHRHRKAMFLSLMSDEDRASMRRIFRQRWRARLCRERSSPLVLHEEARVVLCESAFDWCGIDVDAARLAALTETLGAMIDASATLGPRHWRAELRRRRLERELAARVAERRREAPGGETPFETICFHVDREGRQLGPEVAAVELLNLLRPIVAIARFIVFAAHALASHPGARRAVACGEPDALHSFALEVRRFYPFFPLVAARVRHDFEWEGYRFVEGRRVMLDLYGTDHDPKLWREPDHFEPGRFRHRLPTPFDLIPQGGGEHAITHRCPGEWMTNDLVEEAARLLVQEMRYEVPGESLCLNRSIPALPANGFVIRELAPTGSAT